MTKTELVAAMAENAELTKKDSDKVLNAFISIVTNELKKGNKVVLPGFGTFETGETMKIAACKAPKFKAGKTLKDAINA